MEITVSRTMSHMLWNIGADRGRLLRLCGICNEIKMIHVDSWCRLKEGLTGKEQKKNTFWVTTPSSVKSLQTCSNKRLQVVGSPTWVLNPRLPFEGRLNRCPFVECTVCSTFVRMISIHYGTVLGRMSFFNTLHAFSCQNQNCMSTVVFWLVGLDLQESNQENLSFQMTEALKCDYFLFSNHMNS